MSHPVSMRAAWITRVGLAALLLACTAACTDTDTDSGGSTPPTGVAGTTAAATLPTPTIPPSISTAAPSSTPSSVIPATTAAAASSTPDTSVPADTRLRIADQGGLFEGVLAAAGMDQDIPYEVSYVTLSPGPLQLLAFRAGEVDLGVVSPLGLIQAAAGAVDLRAVGRWRADFALFGLISAPGVDGVHGWEDLRGRRVAFQRDTMGEALVMLALADAGMTFEDIDVVDVLHADVDTALQRGDADVGVTGEPFVSLYLEANPTANYVLGIETPTAQSTIVVASDDVLEDPALAAAAAEYLARLDRAFTQLTSDEAAFLDIVVAVWHLDRAAAQQVLEHSEGVRMQGVPGDLAEPYQQLIDLLVARGDIDPDLDATSLFDPRFEALFHS